MLAYVTSVIQQGQSMLLVLHVGVYFKTDQEHLTDPTRLEET